MKKFVAVTAALAAVIVGGATVFAAGSEGYSYLAGQENSARRNELYSEAEALPEDEREEFLNQNGIAEEPYSEEAAAGYSFNAGRERGASYRQDSDEVRTQDVSGYSFLIGQQRGASYPM